MSLQSPTRASGCRCQSQLPLLCGSTVPFQLLLRELRHPFSNFLPPPDRGIAAPLISPLINRTAHRPNAPPASPSPSSQKGDEMHDNKGRFQPDQFPELSPTESHTGTTKDDTPDTPWHFKLICISAALFSPFSTSFAFSQPSLVLVLVFPRPASQFGELHQQKIILLPPKDVFCQHCSPELAPCGQVVCQPLCGFAPLWAQA